MKSPLFAAFALTFTTAVFAADRGTLIFEDDFNRNESQETTDEIGKGWGSNSKSRAGGNKQVDLKDGALRIKMHPTADHAVSVTHEVEFRDGAVRLRFMLEDAKDVLGLNFADLTCKEVWAGHLFKVDVSTKSVQITDLKTGQMDLKVRTASKAGTLLPEQKQMLATKKRSYPVKLETGKWYEILVEVAGDTAAVSIDGNKVGAFASEGIAHPTKKMLRLSVPREAVVDDVKIYSMPATAVAR